MVPSGLALRDMLMISGLFKIQWNGRLAAAQPYCMVVAEVKRKAVRDSFVSMGKMRQAGLGADGNRLPKFGPGARGSAAIRN